MKLKFWITQPVFHIYNLQYWLKPPGLISTEPPAANKYLNLINNKLFQVDENLSDVLSDVQLKKICNFIADYYIIHQAARYTPSVEDIFSYLQSANQPAFINLYQEPQLLFEKGGPTDKMEEEIISVISARCLNLSFIKKGKITKAFPLYYIDNLCVKPEYRKKGIAPEVIQTLHYNISRRNKAVNTYMFKREGQLNAIVPLVCYDTHCFDITYFNETNLKTILNPAMNCIELTVNQLNLLIAFIKEQMQNFECVILPDVSNLMHLIKLEKLLMYGVLFQGELIAVYVFRALELYYENKKTVECIAILSIKNINQMKNITQMKNINKTEVMVAGFNMSLLRIKARLKIDMILIEETAHSAAVLKAFYSNPHIKFQFKTPTAFFLYNYACYSIKNTKTLLIY